MITTTFDLIRHGEPIGGKMYRGSGTDHALSTKGWQQMHASVAEHLLQNNNTGWDVIVTSPLIRCQAFATTLSEQLNTPLITYPNLSEAFYGEWEGKTHNEIKTATPNAYAQFYRDPVNHRPAGAEALQAFSERVMQAFADITTTFQGQHILLISHAGVMRCLIAQALQAPIASQQQIYLPFAKMIRIERNTDQISGTHHDKLYL
jgi:broad specificity phosphatase PhoE